MIPAAYVNYCTAWLLRGTAAVYMFVSMMSPALANNNLFLSGDAFFHSSADADEIPTLFDQPLQWSRYGSATPGAFCNNIGSRHLTIIDRQGALAAQITKAVTQQAADDEAGPWHIFVYNRDFDLNRCRIGLRYNESWVEEASAFGRPPGTIRYDTFVSSGKLIAECWRDSQTVPRLQVRYPLAGMKFDSSGANTAPLLIVSDKVKIVFARHKSVEDLASATQNLTILVVDVDGFKVLHSQDESWLEAD